MKKFKCPIVALVVLALGLFLNIFALVYSIIGRNSLVFTVNTKNKPHATCVKSESRTIAVNLDRYYTVRDTVHCLDTLLTKRNSKSLHIAFIGDSLVRNQFTNYLKV